MEDGFGIVTQTNDVAGIAEGLTDFFAKQQHFNRETILGKSARYRWDIVCQGLVDLYIPRLAEQGTRRFPATSDQGLEGKVSA